MTKQTPKTANLIFDIAPIAERLQHEVSLLREWFKKDYPESDLRVDCDFNGVLFVLKIDISVLMGEEVADNRALLKSTLRLQERDLRNPDLMNGFFNEFNKQVRLQIQSGFNKHYYTEQSKLGLV